MPLEFGLHHLLVGLHIDGYQVRGAARRLHARQVFRQVDHLCWQRRGSLPVPMMYDLAQGTPNSFSIHDGQAFPELIGFYPLDDFRLLPDRVEVHLECRQAIEQLDLQIVDVTRALQCGNLNPAPSAGRAHTRRYGREYFAIA